NGNCRRESKSSAEPKHFFSNFNLLITVTNGKVILRVTGVTTELVGCVGSDEVPSSRGGEYGLSADCHRRCMLFGTNFQRERSDETKICMVGSNCRGGSRFGCWFRFLGLSTESGCERRLDVQRGVRRGHQYADGNIQARRRKADRTLLVAVDGRGRTGWYGQGSGHRVRRIGRCAGNEDRAEVQRHCRREERAQR